MELREGGNHTHEGGGIFGSSGGDRVWGAVKGIVGFNQLS